MHIHVCSAKYLPTVISTRLKGSPMSACFCARLLSLSPPRSWCTTVSFIDANQPLGCMYESATAPSISLKSPVRKVLGGASRDTSFPETPAERPSDEVNRRLRIKEPSKRSVRASIHVGCKRLYWGLSMRWACRRSTVKVLGFHCDSHAKPSSFTFEPSSALTCDGNPATSEGAMLAFRREWPFT